jgi:hypothetical protein
MNILSEVFDKLSFRVDYKKKDELKAAIIYFFGVFIFLRLLAVGIEQTEFFALVLTIGALVYLAASIYFLQVFLEPKIQKMLKKYTKVYDAIFAIVYSVIILWIIYLMFAPITIGAENTIISLFISLALIILPASFSDEIIERFRFRFGSIMLFLPAMPDLNNINISGINISWLTNLFSGSLPDLSSPFPYFQIIESLTSKYGLTLIIFVIVVALFAFKIIRSILQLLLIVIIIWAITKYLGIF